MESLIFTPEGFAWIADRATLATLPIERQQWWREFHEEVWEAIISDPDVHEGCAPADDLHSVQRELVALQGEREDDIEEAHLAGYKQACSDIIARVEAMRDRGSDGFDGARKRIVEGIARHRERGPAREGATA